MGFKRDRGPKPSMFSPRTEFRTLQTEVKLTRKRYLMLLVSGIIYFSNNMQWSSFITITEGTMAYYNVHIFQVNLLSMSYMMFFVFSLITMRIIDKKGVRVGLIAAATLNCVGSLIRVLPYPFMDPRDCQYSYVFLLTGQCISALAMTFLMAMPSLIAARWFGSDERGAMTAVGSQLINLGGAVGFLTSFIIDSEGNGMQTMLVGEALLCTLGLILIYVFIEEEPKYPPTVTGM